MYKDFEVVITKQTAAVSEKGFGTILIVDHEKERPYSIVTADNLETLGKGTRARKLGARIFQQNPPPQEVAVVGTAKDGDVVEIIEKIVNKDWFWLTCTDNTPETVSKIAEYIETQEKMYGVTMDLSDGEPKKVDTKFLETLEYEHTFIMQHDNTDAFAAEALAVHMSHNVGGKTAHAIQLSGVTGADVTLDDIDALHKNGAFTYVEKMGVLQTTEGYVTDGEQIDVVLGGLWIKSRIEEGAMYLAINNDKIPYTNRGIGMLVGVVDGVLSEATTIGIIAEEDGEPQYEIDYRKREDVPANDVANRDYSYIEFTAILAGAIHSGKIHGTLRY